MASSTAGIARCQGLSAPRRVASALRQQTAGCRGIGSGARRAHDRRQGRAAPGVATTGQGGLREEPELAGDGAEHPGVDREPDREPGRSGADAGDVARLRADIAAVAAAVRPVAGARLDALWSEIDALPDATVARALDAAQGLRRIADAPPAPPAGGRPGPEAGRSFAGLAAAFALGLFAGVLWGRRRS